MAEKEIKDEQQTDKPLDKMTVVELREVAKKIPDVKGVSGMKKDQLLAIIKEARGIAEEKPVKKKKTAKKKSSGPRKEMTVKELKEEITRLRAEKEELRKDGDRKKIEIIRRRINRMKKKTRKAA
jgi:hypothetical protein